jgi:hypothetical protein
MRFFALAAFAALAAAKVAQYDTEYNNEYDPGYK